MNKNKSKNYKKEKLPDSYEPQVNVQTTDERSLSLLFTIPPFILTFLTK